MCASYKKSRLPYLHRILADEVRTTRQHAAEILRPGAIYGAIDDHTAAPVPKMHRSCPRRRLPLGRRLRVDVPHGVKPAAKADKNTVAARRTKLVRQFTLLPYPSQGDELALSHCFPQPSPTHTHSSKKMRATKWGILQICAAAILGAHVAFGVADFGACRAGSTRSRRNRIRVGEARHAS
jgi:hypothetical protein